MVLNQTQLYYGFALGHVPKLSALEAERWLRWQGISFNVKLSTEKVLIIETDRPIDAVKVLETLGGTIKIFQISYYVSPDKLSEAVCSIVNHQIADLRLTEKKFQFGFSFFGNRSALNLREIGLTIKKDLKKRGRRVRFVTSKEESLSSVIIHKEKLINQGLDIVIIADKDKYYVGQTAAAQQYEDYSRRDYGRPERDDKSGMLPPKLAKIMLNLSQTELSQTILDPFCGSGTIIQEALILGYQNIIGSDIAEKAVANAENNIKWLAVRYHLKTADVKIYQLDARKLSDKFSPNSIDCVITEPYLGPAKHSRAPRLNRALIGNDVAEELSQLYLQSFMAFSRILKKGGKVVIILPVINGKCLDILNKIEKIGFSTDRLDSGRGSVIYSRPKQMVAREIFIFIKA